MARSGVREGPGAGRRIAPFAAGARRPRAKCGDRAVVAGRLPRLDLPRPGGPCVEVEAVDVERAHVRVVLHDGFVFARAVMDLDGAVVSRRIRVCRAGRKEQERDGRDEREDPCRFAHVRSLLAETGLMPAIRPTRTSTLVSTETVSAQRSPVETRA